MAKGPVGCGRPLSPRHFVGGAEVDSLVDTDTDDITSRIGKAMIDLRCVGSRARHREGRSIPEEMLESTRHGPCNVSWRPTYSQDMAALEGMTASSDHRPFANCHRCPLPE